MAKYIDADKLKTEIERLRSEAEYEKYESFGNHDGFIINEAKEYICMLLKSFIDSLQQEQPEVDLEYIENDAELIANKIMIGVQSNRYHTCVYNTERNDFNHSHLVQAARKGIELGLKARKEEIV